MAEKKYKCPYCESRKTRSDLSTHIEDKHFDLIPQGYSPYRVAFNAINKKEHGKCVVCGKETDWNETAGKYNRLCGNPKCRESLRKSYSKNMIKVYNTDNLLKDDNFQQKMLKNRSISGEYRFKDGGKRTYTGSFENKTLEFMDKVLNIPSSDIMTPGPTLKYEYNGETHSWITDIYYIPANLIIEVKDGGDNPNNRQMTSYREKQISKEKMITNIGTFNYLRLTNNNFMQLMSILAELKDQALSGKEDKAIIRIHEDIEYNQTKPQYSIDTFIFDFGGVLVKNLDTLQCIKDHTDIPINHIEEIYNIWINREDNFEELYLDEFIQKLNSIMPDHLHKYIPAIISTVEYSMAPYHYSVSLLRSLKNRGYKLYYLSNWSSWGIDILEQSGKFDKMIELFDGGIISGDVGVRKPDKNIYELLIDRYELEPSDCIFFDDRSENVKTAEELGIYGMPFNQNTVQWIYDNFLQNSVEESLPPAWANDATVVLANYKSDPRREILFLSDEYMGNKLIFVDDDGKFKAMSRTTFANEFTNVKTYSVPKDESYYNLLKNIKKNDKNMSMAYIYEALSNTSDCLSLEEIEFNPKFKRFNMKDKLTDKKISVLFESVKTYNDIIKIPLFLQEDVEYRDTLISEYSNLNIYEDSNGYFLMDEETGLRIPSKKDITDITEQDVEFILS